MNTPAGDLEFKRFDLCPGIRLSVLPTRKLKTVLVKLYFTGDLDDGITERTLIPMVLKRGSRRLPSLQAMARRLEGLYGSSVMDGVFKIGEWHITSFRLESVNGRFLPGKEDVLGEALGFLRELIFDPRLDDGVFRSDVVEQEKNNLGRQIDSLIDDKDQYAAERLVRAMCPEEPYRLFEFGETARLPGIHPENLTAAWKSWSAGYPLEIYASGDLDAGAARDFFAGIFNAPRVGLRQPAGAPAPRAAGKTRFIEEKLDVNQGKLCLGFRHGMTYTRGDIEAAILMNGILGSYSHSKLFQNVREKASLAYDVSSSLEKTKGFLFIAAGIAADNRQKALDIILAQVEALKRGEITPDELVSTRESILNQLQMLKDNFSNLMEIDFVWSRHRKAFELDEYKRRLSDVTPERIAWAARALELDTVYFLRN